MPWVLFAVPCRNTNMFSVLEHETWGAGAVELGGETVLRVLIANPYYLWRGCQEESLLTVVHNGKMRQCVCVETRVSSLTIKGFFTIRTAKVKQVAQEGCAVSVSVDFGDSAG